MSWIKLGLVNTWLFLAFSIPQVRVWLISAGFAAFSWEKPRLLNVLPVTTRKAGSHNSSGGFQCLSTWQFLQGIKIDWVSAGMDYEEVWIQFPRRAEDPLVLWELSDMSTSSFAFGGDAQWHNWCLLVVYFDKFVGLVADFRYIGTYLLLFSPFGLNLKQMSCSVWSLINSHWYGAY